jgi:hypothetical protein
VATKPLSITYIAHVIGTLSMWHVEMALESLHQQHPFHWDRFVLYNGSDSLPTEQIMNLVPTEFFDRVEVFPYNPTTPKSCSADWLVQMQEIGGSDRYLCHKFDFYLPPWTCAAFEAIKRKDDFLVLFNKYDLKSRARPEDIQRYANLSWKEGLRQPDIGRYGPPECHVGKMAVPFMQVKGGADGTMHGYTDGVRDLYRPSVQELTQRWGVASSFRVLEMRRPRIMHRNPAFFACHIWHESPDRNDWNKSTSPDERF